MGRPLIFATAEVGRYFDSEVSPALTPLVFDPSHAFPFLSHLSTSLAFFLQDPRKEAETYARVKVPTGLKQWISLEADVPAGQRIFIPLCEVIRGNVQKLYGGMKLSGTTLFRLTRDADVEIDDDEADEAHAVREQIGSVVTNRSYASSLLRRGSLDSGDAAAEVRALSDGRLRLVRGARLYVSLSDR